MSVLDDLKAIIDSSGIFTGFEHSCFGINDENTAFRESDNWTAFKTDGGGRVDPLYGEPNVRLWIGGERNQQKTRYDKSQEFIDFVNGNAQSGDIFHILVQSDLRGPFSLEGNRSYFEIDLRLSQNRG